jgi:hypothetical protein
MAQILISEPHQDVSRMVERMVARLGHTPNCVTVPSPHDLTSAEVYIIEPATPTGAVYAQAASIAVPDLPLICASLAGPPPALTELGVTFAACLLKPFTIEQLRDAIDRALRHGRRRPCERHSAA